MKICNLSNQSFNWTSKARNNKPKHHAKRLDAKNITHTKIKSIPFEIKEEMKEAFNEGMCFEDIVNKFDLNPLTTACVLSEGARLDYNI